MLPKAFLAAALASSATAFVLLPPDAVQPATNIDASVHDQIPESDSQAPEAPQVPEAQVPEVPQTSEGAFKALPFEEGHHPFPDPRQATWTAVNCPGCPLTVYKSPFDDKDNTTITLPDAPNHLILRVDIDHTESGDRLLVNGFEMFPDIDIINGHLSAPQVPSGPPRSHEKLRKHKSGKAAKKARREIKDHKEERKFRHEGKVKHDEAKAQEGEFRHGDFRHGEDKFHKEHMDHQAEHQEHQEHHDEIKAHGEDQPTEAPAPAPTNGDDLPPPPPPPGPRPTGQPPFDGPHHHPHHHPDDHHQPHGLPPPPPPGKFVDVPLGFSLMRHTIGKDAEAGDDFEKISLTLQIIAVNGDLINNIPAVSIYMDRTTDGKLLIGRVGVEGEDARPLPPPHNHPFGHHLEGDEKEGFEGHHPHHPHDEPEEDEHRVHAHGQGHHGHGMDMAVLEEKLAECTNFLCRWKVMAEAHVKPHKCGGKGKGKAHHNHHDEDGEEEVKSNKHHHHPHPEEGEDEFQGQEEGEFKGHHHHHHHEDGQAMGFHHMHGHEHSLGLLLSKFSSHVLVPVFIGIAAGVMVSFVGMVVGSLIVSVWRMLFRRSVAHHVSIHRHASKAAQREPGALEEKAGLMAVAEDDLPPYVEEEQEVKEVNEKA